MLGEEYNAYKSALCNFLYSYVISSLLTPNIFLNSLFTNTLKLCSSLKVRDQISQPYNTTGNIIILQGTKGDWNFRISDLVKNPDGTDFNPCGEFRWSPEGPISKIHSPHLHAGAPEIFSDVLRFVQMLKRGSVRKATGCTYLSIVKQQPWFLSLQWKTCL